jgi:hypothetical protein
MITESKKAAAPIKQGRKHFRNEAEAIDINQKKFREQLTQHFLNIEPSLYNLALPKLSVQDMEEMQNQMITQLDNIREIDPTTGILCETKEFTLLEEKYLLLLNVLHYFEQKKILDTKSNDYEVHETEKGLTQNISCFSFLFNKKRSVK